MDLLTQLKAAAIALTVWGGSAFAVSCVSNPTPHPVTGDDDNLAAQADATSPPAGESPDRDNDGYPDCEQDGGTWLDGECNGGNDAALTPDAAGTQDGNTSTDADVYDDPDNGDANSSVSAESIRDD